MNSHSIIELSNERLMIGAAEPNGIEIVSIENYDIVYTIKEEHLFESSAMSKVGVFCFDGALNGKIVVGCPSGGVCVIDENSYGIKAKKEKVHSTGIQTIFRVKENIYITSAFDFLLKLWEIE